MIDPVPAASPTLAQVLERVHHRLILTAVILAGVTLIFSGILVIRGYADRNLALIAHTVGYTVEPAVVFGDINAVRTGMVSVIGNDAVRMVEVRDENGRVLANWSRPVNDITSWIERAGGQLLWPSPARHEVHRGKDVIAEVRVFGSAGGVVGYLLSGILIALACLGLTILATRILARRLQQDIIAPLDHLATVAHLVRTKREFNRRVSISGIAEIDKLGQDFNALLAELEGWQAGLTLDNEDLLKRATKDMLTGLGNRSLFEQRLAKTIDEAERYRTTFAVLYLDANGLKQVNDRFGHEAGDAMLVAIGKRLHLALRKFDDVFRLGGDEFGIVLLPSVTRDLVEGLLERIARSMEPAITLPNGEAVTISLSVGVAVYPDDGSDAGALLRHADAAMYLDKQRRRSNTDAGLSHA